VLAVERNSRSSDAAPSQLNRTSSSIPASSSPISPPASCLTHRPPARL